MTGITNYKRSNFAIKENETIEDDYSEESSPYIVPKDWTINSTTTKARGFRIIKKAQDGLLETLDDWKVAEEINDLIREVLLGVKEEKNIGGPVTTYTLSAEEIEKRYGRPGAFAEKRKGMEWWWSAKTRDGSACGSKKEVRKARGVQKRSAGD